MEKFRPSPLTEVSGSLLDVCQQLVGPDRDHVRRLASETLLAARVNHAKGNRRAQDRETLHRKNRSMNMRCLCPTTGTSLLETLNHLLELEEEKTARGPLSDQMILPSQICRNRHTLALLCESIRNTLSAVVSVAMTQHDYRQRDARVMFELLIQDKSSVKPDSKFFEKRSEIKGTLKDRFGETNWFQLTPAGTEIKTELISESEAEETYAFLELCARILGDGIFAEPFDPNQPIPELASNARNFDEENALQHRRILAVVSPPSFENLVESLGYTTMNKKAKGPVLNTVIISGNGNNGNQGKPLREKSEADKQDDINAIVNDYADSAQFRRLLKHPKLEVVVDGTVMSAPFAATTGRRFQLPGPAKFVQVFATQNGLRNIVSSLSLLRTGISGGKNWYSELELEGKQVVKLTVEPAMDDDGKLASSSLVVGYQPRLTFGAMLGAWLQAFWARDRKSWPAWITKPIFASIIGVLALAPFFTIDIYSLSAFFILMLSLTAFLLLAGKIGTKWRPIWPHHVAIDSFVAVMLVTMLFFGILPIGRLAEPAIASIPINSPAKRLSAVSLINADALDAPELKNGPGGSSDEFVEIFNARVVTLAPIELTNYSWSAYGSPVIGSQFNLSIQGANYDPTQDYLLVRPTRLPDSWQGWLRLNYTEKELNFLRAALNVQSETLSPTSLQSSLSTRIPENAPTRVTSDVAAVVAKRNAPPGDRAHVAKPVVDGSVTLRDVFQVEVLVDTTEMIALIGDSATIATELATPAMSKQPTTPGTPDLPVNAAIADAGNQPASDSQASTAEARKAGDPTANVTAVSTRKSPAWVVFESPTQLGSLNKGDLVNANFKPILSTTDPDNALLVCSATGVVQDKRTSGTDVEVRVGLKFTGVHNGKPVNGSLDLLLRDCALDKENSHHGFLAVPQNQIAEVARIEPRLRKP